MIQFQAYFLSFFPNLAVWVGDLLDIAGLQRKETLLALTSGNYTRYVALATPWDSMFRRGAKLVLPLNVLPMLDLLRWCDVIGTVLHLLVH